MAVQIANAAAHPHEHEHAHAHGRHHHHALALGVGVGVDDIAVDGAEPVGQVGGPGIGLAGPANDVRVIGGEL